MSATQPQTNIQNADFLLNINAFVTTQFTAMTFLLQRIKYIITCKWNYTFIS